jgi:hypothetical protein
MKPENRFSSPLEYVPAMQEIPRHRSSLWQKIVGLFVTWQLVFLFSINLLAFLPLAEADDDELTDSRSGAAGSLPDDQFKSLKFINSSLMTWAQATGQLQAWWLFAPSFPTEATFPLVTLHWDKGASADVRLHADQEPDDPTFYVRLPGSQDRLFHYEMRLGLVATAVDETSLQKFTSEWRELFKERVGRQCKSMRAYMRWRMETFGKEHPELPPPDEITLSFRVYKTPEPGTSPPTWAPPLEQPVARWLPSLDGRKDCLPLEFYDPVKNHFTRLAAKE